MSKNVEINYKKEDGGYEALYPKTNGDMVEVGGKYTGSLNNALSMINVEINSVTNPELIITTVPGASVTATCDGGGVSGNANDSGNLVLRLPYYGTYTVVASLMGVSAQEEIIVDTVKQYPITIMITGFFGVLSWANINTLLSQGRTSFFSVGDVKTLTLNGTAGNLNFSNTTAYATIIGINHNASIEGNNRLHLQLALDNKNTRLLGMAPMNPNATNSGGWALSQMRADVCDNLVNCLPNDLRVIVKDTIKYTSTGSQSTNILSISKKFFLLSEFEAFGQTVYSVPEEKNYQQQYAWYAKRDRIKYSGSEAYAWWLRSPQQMNLYNFCQSASTGAEYYSRANNSYGVAPCFCI